MRKLKIVAGGLVSGVLIYSVSRFAIMIYHKIDERRILKAIVERLSADSRIAEVLVTQSRYNEATKRIETTIKFLEYDAAGSPLAPRLFTFQGNIIQFQSLVIRFDETLITAGDKLRGKSAYLFLRVFMLDDERTESYELTETDAIPRGYKIPGIENDFEKKLWQEFWTYALEPDARAVSGIKNAQIEAPGSMFLPGTVYTIRIEHDGGMRIDAEPIPEILRTEMRGFGGTS